MQGRECVLHSAVTVLSVLQWESRQVYASAFHCHITPVGLEGQNMTEASEQQSYAKATPTHRGHLSNWVLPSRPFIRKLTEHLRKTKMVWNLKHNCGRGSDFFPSIYQIEDRNEKGGGRKTPAALLVKLAPCTWEPGLPALLTVNWLMIWVLTGKLCGIWTLWSSNSCTQTSASLAGNVILCHLKRGEKYIECCVGFSDHAMLS